MKRHFIRSTAALLVVAVFSFTAVATEPSYVIDTPTTGLVDYSGYDLNFRLFSSGGVLSRLSFGIFNIVNLGFGWELSRVIGSDDVIASPPSLFIKIRPFTGSMTLPDFAFGYDGQGYFYDKDRSEFLEPGKGVFMVLGRELFAPGLEFNAGANISDFKTNAVYGFVSAHYTIEDKVMVLAEYDHIRYFPESRLNLGFRILLTEELSIDLAGRDLGAAGRSTERTVRISYLGRF